MQLTRKFEIQSAKKVIEFLNTQPVGRIATIDSKGCPQVIPMNFVYVRANTTCMDSNYIIKSDAVYMHSHPVGEKLDNIRRNSQVGFEVDRHICFLPSYYFHSSDASQADTLYISVIKIVPREMHGKYKIGQHWTPAFRLRMARNIVKREGKANAIDILNIMGIEILSDDNLNLKEEPIM